MDTKESSAYLKVVMIPWLAHGHISPYFELAKKLSKKNFSVYICSTPINLTSIRLKLLDNKYPSVHLVEFHLPSFPELPPHYHTRYGLPPHLIPLLEQVFQKAAPGCITTLLDNINPDLVIYDICQPWVHSITKSRSKPIPAIHFQTAGFATTLFAFCMIQRITIPFPALNYRESEMKKMMKMSRDTAALSPPSGDYSAKDGFLITFDGSCDIILVKGCNEMDGKYSDFLSQVCKKKVMSVGPLLAHESFYDDHDDHVKIFEWLNKKVQLSTVFVSFGEALAFW